MTPIWSATPFAVTALCYIESFLLFACVEVPFLSARSWRFFILVSGGVGAGDAHSPYTHADAYRVPYGDAHSAAPHTDLYAAPGLQGGGGGGAGVGKYPGALGINGYPVNDFNVNYNYNMGKPHHFYHSESDNN